MIERAKITSPLPWFGSNRRLAKNVGAALKGCEWVGIPFAGGMCELGHIDARTINANDLHRHAINLVRVMADPKLGPALYRKLRRYVLHPDFLDSAQRRCIVREASAEFISTPDPLWAEDYFVSAWFSRSETAGTRYEFTGGISERWNASGGDSAKRVQSTIREIPSWRRAFRRVTFTTLDAFDFLAKCKDEPGHGVYCDPPFPGPGDRYKHRFSEEQQRRLAARMAEFTIARVVMRFYDHPLIRELYPERIWEWNHFTGQTQANKVSAEVLLIRRPGIFAQPVAVDDIAAGQSLFSPAMTATKE